MVGTEIIEVQPQKKERDNKIVIGKCIERTFTKRYKMETITFIYVESNHVCKQEHSQC